MARLVRTAARRTVRCVAGIESSGRDEQDLIRVVQECGLTVVEDENGVLGVEFFPIETAFEILPSLGLD